MLPPGDPWYRRHWARYNRPFPGCGCFYAVLVLALFWWFVSFFFSPVRVWY